MKTDQLIKALEATRGALKFIQWVCGFGLLIISFISSHKGDYAHATYDLILAVAFIFWSERKS